MLLGGANNLYTKYIFTGNNVVYKSFHTNGIHFVMVVRGGKFSIGENFAMNNGIKGNPIGDVMNVVHSSWIEELC